MTQILNVSRRGLLKGAALSGLVLGFHIGGVRPFASLAAAQTPERFEPNVFLAIEPNGDVLVTVPRSEMGQGIRTSLAMVVADELDADWASVKVVQAQGDKKYGDQNTDGSQSIRIFLQPLREAGGTARRMLIYAAAQKWEVSEEECRTEPGFVLHPPSSRRIAYGEIAPEAAKLPESTYTQPENVPLKDPSEWRYIGKPVPIVDLDDMVTGKAVFGIDVNVPNMKYASILRPPVYGGTLKSHDDAAAKAVAGVEQVVVLDSTPGPAQFNPLGGLAVIATNTWAAMQGRDKLTVEWDPGPNAGYDTDAFRKQLEATVLKPGKVVRESGDVDAALAGAAKRVTADYFVPHMAQAPMEPMAATAHFTDGKCEVWAATQDPQSARSNVAKALGIAEEAVAVNVTLLGGGFGRKSKPDYVVEAALLSRAVGAPVKVTWTREDDLRHGYVHTITAQHLEAGLDADGKPVAWLHRTAFPSIGSTFAPDVEHGMPLELSMGVTDMPYDIPNVRCENGPARNHVRIGWYRSVLNIPHVFATSSFVDELAAAAGRDPKEYLLSVLGEPRTIDLPSMGVEHWNYNADLKDYPVDTGRLRNVIELAAEKSGWGGVLPERKGRGIAAYRSFLSYVAVVALVSVSDDGRIVVERVDVAVDAGQTVHPDRVTAQFEGATIMGLGNTLFTKLEFKDGVAQQPNFTDYLVARMDSTPETHVHLVPSRELPCGVGEPGVPPVGPAICNAIFAATGQRVRALPVEASGLKFA